MTNKRNTLRRMAGAATDSNPHLFKKLPSNCISCYRLEEGLSLQKLAHILGITSHHSARELCESPHPSAKYIYILAIREGLSTSEFRLRYTPLGEDAA